MKKVGIIRCRHTEDTCPGTACFMASRRSLARFAAVGEVEIVGFTSCGGCSGRRVEERAAMLAKRGAEMIFLSSCMVKASRGGMRCPFLDDMRAALEKSVGLPLIDGTH